jgi:hypothetical protein
VPGTGPARGNAMNHRHRKILHALFAHPISNNVDFKDVVHVLEELGAEIENKSGNRIGVRLAGHSAAFVHAHHSLPKDEVVQMRKFLTTCGIDPEQYPL